MIRKYNSKEVMLKAMTKRTVAKETTGNNKVEDYDSRSIMILIRKTIQYSTTY